MKTDKVYFPGLNGLRFIAALMVIVHHIEKERNPHGLSRVLENLGPLGVSLFFVLSGFLITYLLLNEQKTQGDIEIKNFYIRRILKIWPVYYLMLGACYFVFPIFSHASNAGTPVYFYLFMLPNIAVAQNRVLNGFGQSWSVGVEEQFYLMWPWIVKYFKKYIPLALYCIVLSKIVILYFLKSFPIPVREFLWHLQIEKMAVGGLGACAVFYGIDLSLLYTKRFQILGFVCLIALPLQDKFPCFYPFFEAVILCLLILNVATNPKPLLNLEKKGFHYLGKISYGIYMYHAILVYLTVKYLKSGPLIYIVTILGSIIISALSYELYERKFLNFKVRFARVLSGDEEKA